MQSNLEIFLSIYKLKLKEAIENRPLDYSLNNCSFEELFERMKAAIIKNTFNKDSHAFKNTCKELNLSHTYKAISEFINS